MAQLTRRAALAGLSAAALAPGHASRVLAQAPDRVQRGEVKKFPSMIPGIANILVREVTYLPGGRTSRAMPHSMVCECKVGVLEVSQDSMATTISGGGMRTSHRGMVETVENKGTGPAIMRVIELVPAWLGWVRRGPHERRNRSPPGRPLRWRRTARSTGRGSACWPRLEPPIPAARQRACGRAARPPPDWAAPFITDREARR